MVSTYSCAMGGAFSGSSDVKHVCRLIIAQGNVRTRPTDDVSQGFIVRYAEVNLNIDHHATLTAFKLAIIQSHGYDNLDGFDLEMEYQYPAKRNEKVLAHELGIWTRLVDLVANRGVVFTGYLFKKSDTSAVRRDLHAFGIQNTVEPGIIPRPPVSFDEPTLKRNSKEVLLQSQKRLSSSEKSAAK